MPVGARVSGLLWPATFGIAAAYIVLFLIKLPHNIAALGWSPSVASAYVMPETLVNTGTGGHTVMGSSPQWVSLWFGLLTAKLPLHRELWDIAPTLDLLATALIVGWSVVRLASRRAAVLATLIVLVASPLALTFLMAPFSHNTVYPCTALLGAYLIWLARADARRRIVAFAVPPVLGVVVGACVSSDLLLDATAVIPLGLAALFALVQRGRRPKIVALSALTTAAVSVPVAKLTSSIMLNDGFITVRAPVHFAALSELPARAELLFRGLKVLFNGYLGGPEARGTLYPELGLLSDVVMAAALLTLVVVGTLTCIGLIRAVLSKASVQTPTQLTRSLYIVYWVGAAAIPCVGFWLAGEGPQTLHESYYMTSVFAAAAVIPLLLSARTSLRLLIPAGAACFFFAGFVGLTNDYVNITTTLAGQGREVVRLAEANHVQAGYTNFGDASGITWASHYRVVVRPIAECENPGGVNLCPGFQAYVPAWYVPQARPSFLLVDQAGIEIQSLPEGLGKPLASYSFGSMQMYIYPYDIASRLG
jgi:hypothetical protein